MFLSSCLFGYNIYMTMREKPISSELEIKVAVPIEGDSK